MNAYQATETLVRGDDEALELEFTDCDNDDRPINLTGSTVMLTLKKDPKDSDEDAVLALDVTQHSEPLLGRTVIEVTDEDWDTGYKGQPIPSGLYHFDVQYVDASGKPKTLLIGLMTVIQDVSHRKVAA